MERFLLPDEERFLLGEGERLLLGEGDLCLLYPGDQFLMCGDTGDLLILCSSTGLWMVELILEAEEVGQDMSPARRSPSSSTPMYSLPSGSPGQRTGAGT